MHSCQFHGLLSRLLVYMLLKESAKGDRHAVRGDEFTARTRAVHCRKEVTRLDGTYFLGDTKVMSMLSLQEVHPLVSLLNLSDIQYHLGCLSESHGGHIPVSL